MRKLRPGRGDTKTGCILWLLLLGMAAYVGYQAIPAQMKAAELKKFMASQAEHRGEEPIERIHARVLARVKELDLPVDKKALHVERARGRIKITYSYSVPIDLFVTSYPWSFEVKIDRLIVIA